LRVLIAFCESDLCALDAIARRRRQNRSEVLRELLRGKRKGKGR